MNNQDINKIKEEFERNGFVTIPDFFDLEELQELKKAVYRIVEDYDMTNLNVFTWAVQSISIAVDTNDKIEFFFEKGAVDEKTGQLVVDRHQSVNKMAHAMHYLHPTFRKITFQPKVQNLLKSLGYVKARVVQSMYIFKNPIIGGAVLPHQDATYLNVIPKKAGDHPKEVGLWLPLEDATEENGCLWFVPGSHKTGLHRQLGSTLDRSERTSNSFEYDRPLPDYDDNSFVAAPAKKGSVVLLDGLVIHKSAHNSSKYPRPIYTFHIYDEDSCEWDPKNWLQTGPGNPFPSLYSE